MTAPITYEDATPDEADMLAAVLNDDTVIMDEPPVTRSELTCVTCGADLIYGGRGPKPKYCDDHKKNSARKNSTASGAKKAPRLAAALTQQIGTAGLALAMLNPIDGMAVINGAEGLGTALAGVAEVNPHIRKFLESGIKGDAYIKLAVSAAIIALPILVNHNLLPIADPKAAEGLMMVMQKLQEVSSPKAAA